MKAFKKYLVEFWNQRDTIKPKNGVKLSAYFFAVIVIYYTLEKVLLRLTTIPFNLYHNDHLFMALFKRLISVNYIPIIFILVVILFHKKLLISWSHFEKGHTIRNLLFYIACILTWLHTTHDFNFYFGQNYTLDRILLLLSLGLIYWKPVGTILFLFFLFPLVGQLEVLEGFSLSTTFLLTRIIILFIAFLSIHIAFKKFRFNHFMFMLGCFVASNYIVSGAGKIMLGEWIFNNQVNYLLPATYANGWQSYLDIESLNSLTSFLNRFNLPSRIFSLLIECGMVSLFFNIKWARILFIGSIIMHLGIFFYSGIFFWMWILVLVGLLFIFSKKIIEPSTLFNKTFFLIAIPIILAGKFWINPSPKVWFDSPLNYTYKFKATLENGEKHLLPPDFFAPYDVQFTFSNFKYLNKEPLLEIFWGAHASKKLHNYLKTFHSTSDIFEYEKHQGKDYYDIEKKEFLKTFINQYISNWNQVKKSRNTISYLRAPRILWNYPRKNFDLIGKTIKSIEVIEVTSYYSKQSGYKEIRNRTVLNMFISKENSLIEKE
ncbi:hypothetical protein [Winogradskyella sp. PG-2]|uniref:hypothetical protein n=1 Tax=Winogradskyella sp. PG-2 TaxID=754409 RepID=UPI00045886CD|nr:hypothetical protein [Winogradskyella sp. PG-2]BAO74617.1 hypothetical protein WPG_0387 [Winogradskyella sp. PG-2]